MSKVAALLKTFDIPSFGGDEHIEMICEFDKTGKHLAVGCMDGRVTIYDVDEKKVWKVLSRKENTETIRSLGWSSCGGFIVTASDNCVYVWNVAYRKCVLSIPELRHQVTKVRFCPSDSVKFVMCFVQGAVKLVHRDSSQPMKSIPTYLYSNGSEPRVNTNKKNIPMFLTAEYHPTGDKLFLSTSECNISVLNSQDLTLTAMLTTNSNSCIQHLCVSPSGSMIIAALKNCDLLIYDLRQLDKSPSPRLASFPPTSVISQVYEPEPHLVAGVLALSVSADEKYLAEAYGMLGFADVVIYDIQTRMVSAKYPKENLLGALDVKWQPSEGSRLLAYTMAGKVCMSLYKEGAE